MTEPLRLITQAESWNQEAQRSTIEMLEEWLAMAKSGEVVSVAISGECADGLSMSAYSRPRHRATMIGALAHMQFRLHRDMENS